MPTFNDFRCPVCGCYETVFNPNTGQSECVECGIPELVFVHKDNWTQPEKPEFPTYIGWDGREHAEF